MATTKKLSFGLDKAGGAALILARIGAALLWIIAALAAVVWVVFLISPRSFAANFGSVDLNVGGAFTLSIKGDLLDYSYNLQNFHDGPVNMVATISTGLARMVVYALLALAFSEMAALCKDLTVWLADGRDATPFQGMVSDRLNRAGWYLIVAPIVGLVNFIVCFLAGTGGNWGLWMSGMMVMIGIILLLIAHGSATGSRRSAVRGKSAVGPRGAGPNRAGPNTEGPNEDSLNIVDSSETGLNTADSNSTGPAGIGHIVLRLDRIMVERGRSLNWLADQVGITNVNLSKIKNNRVSAIRFSALAAICAALDCQPGDILEYVDGISGDADDANSK